MLALVLSISKKRIVIMQQDFTMRRSSPHSDVKYPIREKEITVYEDKITLMTRRDCFIKSTVRSLIRFFKSMLLYSTLRQQTQKKALD
jgi:hypothetical protein